VALLNFGGALGQFIFEPSPYGLVVVSLLLTEQPKNLFGGSYAQSAMNSAAPSGDNER
jgi:hypothetical protein